MPTPAEDRAKQEDLSKRRAKTARAGVDFKNLLAIPAFQSILTELTAQQRSAHNALLRAKDVNELKMFQQRELAFGHVEKMVNRLIHQGEKALAELEKEREDNGTSLN